MDNEASRSPGCVGVLCCTSKQHETKGNEALHSGHPASTAGSAKKRPAALARRYHLIRLLPQVSPPPNAVRQTSLPDLIVPSLTASSRAMGTVADDMFPYLSMVT